MEDSQYLFEGLKVVDAASFIAGPSAATIMADFGAEVIKIEPPGLGDLTRRMGPFAGDDPNPEKSLTFLYLNTNKKSVTLDPSSVSGRKLLHRLIADADVLAGVPVTGALVPGSFAGAVRVDAGDGGEGDLVEGRDLEHDGRVADVQSFR